MAKRTLSIPYHFSLKEELAKNPGLKESDIEMLREWCAKQPHLPNIPDLYLVLFLNSNYYRLEPTKQTIEQYFTMRTHIPEFFSNRDPVGSKEMRNTFLVAGLCLLEKKTPEDYFVIYGRLLDYEPSHFFFNNSVKYFTMFADLLMVEYPLMKGCMYIGDCTGVSFGHVGRLSPMGLKKLVYYVQEAIPIRIKGIHFINAPAVFEMMINMAKPFMNQELIDLVHFHSSMDTIAEYLPLDMIPTTDADQKRVSISIQEKVKELEDKRDWFLEEESVFRVNESLRVGQSKSASDLFGVEGSFKKLDID